MPNLLVDYHHAALYYSFVLLFEKRLGWNLYSPVGYDWYTRGFWKYSGHPPTIKQYLEQPPKKLLKEGVYYVPRLEGTIPYTQKMITFETFLDMNFDYIIATVSNHQPVYAQLINEHKPDATLIRQLGNSYEIYSPHTCRNYLNATCTRLPENLNSVNYHPEFSLEEYSYTPPVTHRTIKNFMNCMPHSIDMPLWYEYMNYLQDFTWKMHGILGEDGLLSTNQIPEAMRTTSFVWHLKQQGDGYGFVVHQVHAMGRPCIVKKHYYADMWAESLLEDSVTCIDLDLGSKQENLEKIRHFSKPENHIDLCENAYERFKEVVNFDKEFEEIKKFLERARHE